MKLDFWWILLVLNGFHVLSHGKLIFFLACDFQNIINAFNEIVNEARFLVDSSCFEWVSCFVPWQAIFFFFFAHNVATWVRF